MRAPWSDEQPVRAPYRPVTDCAISGCDCPRFRRDWHVGETIAGAAAYVTWSVIAWVEARVGRRR